VNCNDYLSMLATLPIDELSFGHAREHAAECRDCDRITRVVAERERNMLLAFDALHSSTPVEQTAFRAIEASRRRRIARYYEMGFGVAMVASLVYLVMLQRSPASAPSATVSERFRLQCLSPDQAAEVLRPGRSPTSSISIPSPSLGIIVVRGSAEDVQKARSALDRYDNAAVSQCAVRVTVPKTP
jgi:hypothetical protein